MCRSKGFTILELLVVVAIIAILAIIVIPNFMGRIEDAEESRYLAELDSVQNAVWLYYTDNSEYPTMYGQPYVGNPSSLDFSKLYPRYLSNLPHFSYWFVDHNGVVFHEEGLPATIQDNILILNRAEYTYNSHIRYFNSFKH